MCERAQYLQMCERAQKFNAIMGTDIKFLFNQSHFYFKHIILKCVFTKIGIHNFRSQAINFEIINNCSSIL